MLGSWSEDNTPSEQIKNIIGDYSQRARLEGGLGASCRKKLHPGRML
jgi:hypothetical protein